MKTPIKDFLDGYASAEGVRLHMPGHKGRSRIGCEQYDITEVSGADVLYAATGIIRESEICASRLFGSSTFYSTEGSTLAIKAMLKLATDGKRLGGERPLILAGRNVHRSFVSAVALLDLDVSFIYPSATSHIASGIITPDEVKEAIAKEGRRIRAVYLTSPDYLGGIADVGGIAEVCREAGVPLLVDNAHGAYLAFLEPSRHPIALGATMCADSAHKTLPVLTGGAYLHVSSDAPEYAARAEEALSLFASTSPSYLTLRSLDVCNAYLADTYREELEGCIRRISDLKEALTSAGVVLLDTEPLKITVSARDMGYTGEQIAAALRDERIECEYSDGDYTVMMLTPDNTDEDLSRLYSALSSLKKKTPREKAPCPIPRAVRAMSVREAVLSLSERVSVSDAKGRVCASVAVSCPPAIPIAIAGEIIDESVIEALRYYGTDEIDVVTKS